MEHLNNSGSVRLETAGAGTLSGHGISIWNNATVINNGLILNNNSGSGINLYDNTTTNVLTNSSTGTITFITCNSSFRFARIGNRNIINNGIINYAGIGLALINAGDDTLNFTNTGLFTINTGTGIQNDAGKTICLSNLHVGWY